MLPPIRCLCINLLYPDNCIQSTVSDFLIINSTYLSDIGILSNAYIGSGSGTSSLEYSEIRHLIDNTY